MTATRPPVLHVCVTCKAGEICEALDERPGHRLYQAIARLNDEACDGARVDLRPVSCLSACERGCAATIFMPGKFGYLLGGLTSELAGDILAYADAYAASATGLVLPSRRAASLRHAMLGRFPSPDPFSDPVSGETPDPQPSDPQPKAAS
jgi:predicted metal-binding protein